MIRTRSRLLDEVAARWRRRDRAGDAGDAGNAIVEFVFAAVIMLVPIVYLIVAVATTQRVQIAVTSAARDAGRAYATAPSAAVGLDRAQVAAQIAFDDAHLGAAPALRFVGIDASSCDAPTVEPSLTAGAEFTVCLTRRLAPPGVPGIAHFHPVTIESRYRVHIDDYRTGG